MRKALVIIVTTALLGLVSNPVLPAGALKVTDQSIQFLLYQITVSL